VSLCALCGACLLGAAVLCPHHQYPPDAGWAEGNRIMCDFIHRGIAPPAPREDIARAA
jgi:hypothetical protein